MCNECQSKRPCCRRSLALGRSTCQECGAALPPDPQPAAQEPNDAAVEVHPAHLATIEWAHRDASRDDDRLISHIRSGVAVGGRFSLADELLESTGLPSGACKHALIRLCARGELREVDRVPVRPRRFRRVFELLAVPTSTTAVPPPGGPAS